MVIGWLITTQDLSWVVNCVYRNKFLGKHFSLLLPWSGKELESKIILLRSFWPEQQ